MMRTMTKRVRAAAPGERDTESRLEDKRLQQVIFDLAASSESGRRAAIVFVQQIIAMERRPTRA